MNTMSNIFQYQRRKGSLLGFLWSIWLYVPSSWRGRLYGALLRSLARPIPSSNAYRLPGSYVKMCHSPDGALATEYVRNHTSIPVPKVLDVVRLPPGNKVGDYTRSWVMISTVLPGTPLFIAGRGHRLTSDVTEAQVECVCAYLRDWIEQLRSLRTPFGQRVCGITGGSFRTLRVGERRIGPFTCPADLHAHESLTLPPELASEPHLAPLLAARDGKSYNIHLVHGDLLLHNILADEDLCPTGIVDWEDAAWMPEYWETVSSSRGPYVNMWRWRDILPKAFPTYALELKLDREVQKSQGE